MRVLMLAERLPPAVGGVERHVAGLTRELVRRGCQVTLVAPAHAPDLPAEGRIAGARALRLPHTNRRRRGYLAAWRWWAERRSLLAEADVIHFHDVYALLHWFGPARLLRSGKPLYLTYHGYEMRYPIPTRARFYRRLAAHLSGGSLCVGHYLVKWFDLRPAAVTYGAVVAPAAPPPLPGTPRAVFVGRLAADTGLELYLRALGRLRRETGRSLPLTVCGDGPLHPSLERLAADEGVDATFLGFVPDPAVHLTQSSHAFASGYLAMLEAMSLGRPVFAVYHNPVKADYFRLMPEAGHVLTMCDSPEALAQALRDPQGNAGRRERAFRFAAQHTWGRLADTYLRLWGAA